MIGKNFRGFKIIKLLGKGGTGEVYLAQQEYLERAVALKITPASHPTLKENPEKPLKEAKILASLQHPNIVTIHEFGQEKDFFYIAIEYIPKGSLKQDIERNTVSEMLMWSMALQVCRALERALQEDIIHSDIKPENILLSKNNFIKLTDFGIADIIKEKELKENEHIVLGTPGYISPEKYAGEMEDFRSDIYSLGCTIYYALTGKAVFSGETPDDIQEKHQNLPVKAPAMYNPSLGFSSNIILAKMLHKIPDDRYQSYGDLLIDIQSLLLQKSIRFANMKDARKLYINADNYISNKKLKISQKLKVFTENMLYSLNCPQDMDIIIVGEWSTHDIAKNFSSFDRVHFMTSTCEVITYLKKQKALVILDCEHLEEKTLDFCHILKKFEDRVFVAIYMKNIPDKLEESDEIPILLEEKFIENLSSLIDSKNFLTVNQLSLKFLLALGQSKYWSFSVKIYKKNDFYAKIDVESGQIKNIEAANQESILMHDLTNKENSWEINKLY